MICKHIVVISFLNKPDLISLHTVKWFEVLQSNNPIRY